jgi:hypothetical protein
VVGGCVVCGWERYFCFAEGLVCSFVLKWQNRPVEARDMCSGVANAGGVDKRCRSKRGRCNPCFKVAVSELWTDRSSNTRRKHK